MTIPAVPEEIPDVLAAHAVPAGQSLQEYVQGQIAALTARAEPDALWDRLHRRLLAAGSRVPADVILAARSGTSVFSTPPQPALARRLSARTPTAHSR